MAVVHRLRGPLLLAAQIVTMRLAWRHYRALPVTATAPVDDAGLVSIVVPARNEARRLPALLESLARLRYRERELIVVDDGSTDGTGNIARRGGARVVRIEGPNPGWTGKSFACWTGAQHARGAWLLFTDADTVHGPDSLGVALATSLERRAGLVSLLARQRCETFWERLLLPYAYALYFVGATGSPIANGQYILVRREDYDRAGGHAAVRDSLVEDVALGREADRRGISVVLARGEDHVEVRMYESLRALWEGFGKNALRFVAVSPRTGIPTVLASILMGASVPAALGERWAPLRAALLLAPAAGLLPWERRFGVPPAFALLYGPAAAVFQTIALDSLRRSLQPGGTVWKGRRY